MRDVFKVKGSPYWQFTLVAQGGSRKMASTKQVKKNLARLVAQDMQSRVTLPGRVYSDIALEDFMPAYREWAESRKKPSTVRGEISLLARFKAKWGKALLRSITDAEVARYVAERRRDGCKKSTINGELAVLSRLCRLAVEQGCLRRLPFNPRGHRFSKLDDAAERTPLTWGQVVDLLECCAPQVRLFALILSYTGLRRGNVASLAWEQVDLEARVIHLAAGQMKGGRGLDVFISEELADELKSVAGTGRIFAEHPDTLLKRLRATMLAAGLYEKGNVCHRLRHAFATDLASRGVDVRTLQALLGHRRIETTMRYVHTDESRQRAAVERRSLQRGRVVVPFKKEG